MESIALEQVLPPFLDDANGRGVWGGTFEFRRGCRYLVKGESGCGKTSLLGYVCGIREGYSGRVLFDGRDAATLSAAQWNDVRGRQLSQLFQDLRLFAELSAVENVMVAAPHGFPSGRAADMLERLGLGSRLGSKARCLSIGEQQRVAFARMLVRDADFYLMDEPVSHVDDHNAAVMVRMLSEVLDRTGAGLIATSIGRDFPIRYDEEVTL